MTISVCGVGGAQNFLPEFRILARKANMFEQCIFVAHWGGGGGGGGGEYYFEVVVYIGKYEEGGGYPR